MNLVLFNFVIRFGLCVYAIVLLPTVPEGWPRLAFLLGTMLYMDFTLSNTKRMAQEQKEQSK